MTLESRRRRALFLVNLSESEAGILASGEASRQLRKYAREIGALDAMADVIDLVCQIDKPFICDPRTGVVTFINGDGHNLYEQKLNNVDQGVLVNQACATHSFDLSRVNQGNSTSYLPNKQGEKK